MEIILSVSKKEKAVIERFAKEQGATVSDTVKRAIFDKIEDEFDIKAARAAYADFEKSGRKTYSYEEVLKELGLSETPR